MIKILIVDDHDLVRMGLSRMLDDVEAFSVIGAASSGEEALQLTRQLFPDVVMMDVKMPGIGGVEATKRIKLVDDNIQVIAVTSCDGDLYPSKLMRAGASAYITKRATPEEMIEAIEAVISGKTYMSSEIAQQLALKSTASIKGRNSPFEQLSDRELQVAMMTIRGKKSSEIANILNVTPKTVNSFRYRIFEKFKLTSDVELVLFAVKHKVFDIESLE
ncbi:DNA-binding response regulator [Candidatus Endobugula sertula]|uniref:DNA-binding response regulator n=1 Tax=Candidatus Endobugula sertula TaxID=62101 RepID=A0A1D2QR89_9GAMM|nr:DNA-binding response regulator [Candidatus Endobugula sertula]